MIVRGHTDLKECTSLEEMKSRKEKVTSMCKRRKIDEGSRKYGDFEDKEVHTLEDLKVQVKELFDRGAFPDDVTLDDPDRLIVELVIPTNIVGEMFHSNVKKIWECLMRNEVSRIGICGMGGVGKTTLVQYVHNKVLENCSTFGNVYWVTVSRDCSIYKLQNEIANIIAEDLLNGVDDEFKRAGLLAKALKKKEEFVLFLDDMWNNFDLNKVGILENVECKLVLTARSKDVCRRMGCDENNIIQVDPLSEENAWNLFVEYYSTHYIQPHIEDIAKQVVKECSGLPLGIITLARSMRGTEDIREWKDILRKLKRSETGLKSIEVISRKDDVESAMKVEIQPEDEEESKRRKMRNEDVGQRVIFGLAGIGKTIIANKNSTSAIKFDKVVIEEEKCPNKSESPNKEESKEKGKERKSKRKGEAKANEKKVIFGMGEIESGEIHGEKSESIVVNISTHERMVTPELRSGIERWELRRYVVFGGLIESITSLVIVTSAASANISDGNIIALALTNLITGFFIIRHGLSRIGKNKVKKDDYTRIEVKQTKEVLGDIMNYLVGLTVAILSLLFFGLVPPLVYALSFPKTGHKDVKIIAAAGASLLCTAFLAIQKTHIQKPKNWVVYVKTCSCYISIGIGAFGLSYFAGTMFGKLADELQWIE